MEYSYKKSEIIPITSPKKNDNKNETQECSVNSSNFNPFSTSPPNDFMAKLENRYLNQVSSTQTEKTKQNN